LRSVSGRKDIGMISGNEFQKVKEFIKNWQKDYTFQTAVGAYVSMGFTVLFALYNGYLGLSLLSVWHGSIGVFYFLLVAIRGMILYSERKNRTRSEQQQIIHRHRTYLGSCALLFLLDLALIVPISMMAVMEKPVDMDQIPAIAMAAYTTYKITMASLHIRRKMRNHTGNILITELRTINFIDALVSVLTLQNTLIMVNSSSSDLKKMLILTAATSAIIYSIIVLISVIMLIQGFKRK
jgi:hypothetical protein